VWAEVESSQGNAQAVNDRKKFSAGSAVELAIAGRLQTSPKGLSRKELRASPEILGRLPKRVNAEARAGSA
jgi:hypothetical protein